MLIADIGAGAVHRLARSGRHHTLLDQLAGEPLGAVNCVYFDQRGVLWITVSTRTSPRSEAIKRAIPDGYVIRMDGGRPRVVASGLCFPNELRVDQRYRYVYVAESAHGRVIRMPLLSRYSKGADTFLNALDSQRTLYSAQKTLVSTRLTALENTVTLYRVLGGG